MTTSLLVIDTDTQVPDVLKGVSDQDKVAVSHETAGQAGLDWAHEHQPDLIILSVELSDINGFMVCKKIRESAALKRIPIIVVSANMGEAEFEKHKKLKTRADVYLQKPIDPENLIAIINQLLALDLSLLEGEADDDLDLEDLLKESKILDDENDKESQGGGADEVAELKTQIENMEHQLDYYRKELDASKLYFKEMQNKKGGDDVELKKKEQEIERLQFELKEAKEELEQTKEQARQTEQEKKDLIASKGDADGHVEEYRTKFEAEREKSVDLEQQIVALTRKIEDLGEQHKSDLEEQQGLLSRSKTLEEDLFKTQEIVDDLQEKISEKDQVTKTRETTFQDEIKELETALEHSRQTNQEVEELLMDRESEIQAMKEALKALQVEKSEAEKGSKTNEKELNKLKMEQEELMARAEQAHAAELEENKQKFQAEMQAQIDELQSTFDKRLHELDQQLTEAERNREDLQAQLEKAETDRQELETSHAKKCQELESGFQAEKAQIEARVQEVEQAHHDTKGELLEAVNIQENVQKERDDLQEKVLQLQAQINGLQEKEAMLIRQHDQETRDLEASHAKRVEEGDVQLKQAYTLQEELCQQRDHLKAEIAAKQAEVESVKGTIQQNESKFQAEMESIEKRNAKIISDQETQIQEVREQLESLKGTAAQLEQKEKENQLLRGRIDQLELGHQTLKGRLSMAEKILEEGIRSIKGENETLDFEE